MISQDIHRVRTIADDTYQVTLATNDVAIPVLVRLFKTLGPVLSDLMPLFTTGKKVDLGGLDANVLADGIKTFVFNLSAQDIEFVADALLKDCVLIKSDGTTPTLTKATRNLHFQGRTLEFFKLLGFAIEVNFSSFLGGWVALSNVVKSARQGAKAT
jgi:hypothetical protein